MRTYSRKVRFTAAGMALVFLLAVAALFLRPDSNTAGVVTVAIGSLAGMVASIVAALGFIDHKQAPPRGPTP